MNFIQHGLWERDCSKTELQRSLVTSVNSRGPRQSAFCDWLIISHYVREHVCNPSDGSNGSECLACLSGLRKDNIGLREVTSSGYSSEQPRSEIRLYRKLTCIHSLLVVMADNVGEIKTSNVS